MPTRLTRPQLNPTPTHVKRRQLRATVAGLAAGLVLGLTGVAAADGAIQLTAPLNAAPNPAPQVRSADTAWTQRPATDISSGKSTADKEPTKASPPPVKTSAELPAKSAARSPDQPLLKPTPATTVSSPLDRFRGALPKLPAVKPATTSVPTPGEVELDSGNPDSGNPDSGNLPALPSGSPWQDRAAGHRAGDSTATSPTRVADPTPDASSPAISSSGVSSAGVAEGGWVARDAINRISPLRDPIADQSNARSTETGVMNEPATVAPENVAATNDAVANEVIADDASTLQSQRPVQDAVTKPSQRQSMSLDEARSAVADTRDVDDDETPLLPPPSTRQTDLVETEPSDPREPERASRGGDPLPKRKPMSKIVESASSSEKSDSAKRHNADKLARGTADQDTASESVSIGDLSASEDAPTLDYTGRPAAEITPTRTVANMRRGIERILTYFYERPEIANGRSNWGMMHSMMVFGADTRLAVGRQHYSTIAWIAGNNNCRGQRLLTHDANGIQAKSGVGLQGHQGQFLAVLGMCNVPTDYPLYAGKVKYDVAALIESEKRACKAGEELTFTLIGLSHYLDTDSRWVAADGTRWDFERLIEEELKQPIVGSACGGTHRLMGYSHALRKRRAEGKPITGQWKRAEIFTEDFIDYAYSLQNRDGSMSTNWLEGRADNGNVDRKIQTTGHIVEWLLTVTPDDQLQDRRLVAAVAFLLRSMGADLDHDWSIGPKGHALRSLAMYHQRVYRAGTPWVPAAVAASTTRAQSHR
ncbi:hypothetical protein Mal15_47840 [Stieleria maiorica]|uniref:Uncharacterized protein n=1 Tax=Stieleria maiorica TaxID=2795974 RepID=A0A5B9MHF0_9BACT|nr:hypothetical protein [Stieleria maiorica]QEG00712.1 hypothetical protein Mal15_47840 [Stieleria maiorica]